MSNNPGGLIRLFARHRVAANLLMALMVLAGSWALAKLNTQFFPNFELDIITVRIAWSGASAEDVERGITAPLEQALRSLDNLHSITSTSAMGIAALSLEYDDGTDMSAALEQVNGVIALARNLPEEVEKPEVSRIIRYEPVARLLLSGSHDRQELRPLAEKMRDELLARGISKIEINGLPKEEIAIQVPPEHLLELDMTLEQISSQIQKQSRDLPAGSVGRDDIARQLRALEQRRDITGLEQLPLISDADGRLITLQDIARLERRPIQGQTTLSVDGEPAVELRLFRAESAPSLGSARILEDWLEKTRPTLPPNIQLRVYDEMWQLISERINLLLINGGGGLLLVVGILLLFLNRRVALWVSIGIPVSFMAALAVLYLAGGSINMISLFGLIMALGIIVDDAIVVGEDALSHFEKGEPPTQAVEGGAYRMLAPVMSSSLTTVAAFIPLMLVGGIIGNMMFEIPLVVICVIIASLVECFLILPGHLRVSFERHGKQVRRLPGNFRRRFDAAFDRFRNGHFRRLVRWAVAHRGITLTGAVGALILAFGLIAGGRLGFTFFPNVEGRLVFASVTFSAGSPAERVEDFLGHLQDTLHETEQALGGNLVAIAVASEGSAQSAGGGPPRAGPQNGSLLVEMVSPEKRDISNREFIAEWEKRLLIPPGVETFTLAERRSGHPGRDIDINLTGADAMDLKLAAQAIIDALKTFPGVLALEDDLPWGQEQLIYRLTPTGEALGLDVESVGRQLRAAFDGALVQIYLDGQDEVEVRISLPDAVRNHLSGLESFQLILPDGGSVPLGNVVEFSRQRGFDVLRHTEGRLAVSVRADVDHSKNNGNMIRENLRQNVLPEIESRYNVQVDFQGRAQDQDTTLSDLKRGVLYAFILMYIILAWVFASYSKPLVVMAIIPFGLVGAIVGHWVMDLELTVLSLFGFFGLSGIVINDSIILVTFYQKLLAKGMAVNEAIVEAACQRLRAVLLTSLTTIAGLTPLLFETSLQAQFLIPMAATISFGLGFATVLVLIIIPALLSTLASVSNRYHSLRGQLAH
ncbi:MAG TPA: efflux RND transporter permease subunit [Gammaproteobacteria bacterium]|nr:efflux RND transporter permease subunit [Gammaproteobacteria bacterium]